MCIRDRHYLCHCNNNNDYSKKAQERHLPSIGGNKLDGGKMRNIDHPESKLRHLRIAGKNKAFKKDKQIYEVERLLTRILYTYTDKRIPLTEEMKRII